ncbi:hypothetical protein DLJ49_03830 [Rhodovulum sp. 12E13]|uniref:hypothetical protein n=1 Tax=Rhodovulum sp. 12E13 TaxID=2203891 RepID=UPI000E18FE32|nr:hypothetical protein [Rhodovulum sp. 12E13]RDC74429.1 hypothetical protein DLJ49_03830 [Rhodovulum sp. 12E13]
MSDGDTRGGAGGGSRGGMGDSARRPDGTDHEDHLAVMARAGLMSHVAELAPPVTAEAMARFRADAARQASNVMALASGRFALCLPPGRREVTSVIAHRLLPIGAAKDAAGSAEAAPAAHGTPRRILPPSLRGQTAPAPATGAGERPPPGPAAADQRGDAAHAAALPGAGASQMGQHDDRPGAPAGGGPAAGLPAAAERGATPTGAAPRPAPEEAAPDPATLARGQAALAEGLSRLAQVVEAAERRASETAAAQERALTELAERIEAATERSAEASPSAHATPATANPVSAGPATAEDAPRSAQAQGPAEGPALAAPQIPASVDRPKPGAEVGTQAGAVGGAVGGALAGAEARITGALVEALGGVEARLSEGMEASHGAQVEAMAEMRRAIEAVSAAQADDSARLSEALATLRLGLRAVNDRLAALEAPGGIENAPTADRPSAAGGAALPRSGAMMEAGAALRPAPGAGFGRGELHGAVQALLGRLDWLEAGAAAAAERRDAPVWRRSAHALRDEAG